MSPICWKSQSPVMAAAWDHAGRSVVSVPTASFLLFNTNTVVDNVEVNTYGHVMVTFPNPGGLS